MNPVVARPIRPRTTDDQGRLWRGLQALGSEDRTFRAYTSRDGQVFLAGMGELHLQVIIDRLKQEFGLNALTGRPQVAYRETITVEADGEGKHVDYSGGVGYSARVKIRLTPLASGEGYVFANQVERLVPEVSRAIDEGVRAEAMNGSLADAPVDDLRVDLCEAGSPA